VRHDVQVQHAYVSSGLRMNDHGLVVVVVTEFAKTCFITAAKRRMASNFRRSALLPILEPWALPSGDPPVFCTAACRAPGGEFAALGGQEAPA